MHVAAANKPRATGAGVLDECRVGTAISIKITEHEAAGEVIARHCQNSNRSAEVAVPVANQQLDGARDLFIDDDVDVAIAVEVS